MTKLIVANWKMNGSITQVINDLTYYATSPITNRPDVVLAMPYLYLTTAQNIILQHKAQFKLASQDLSRFNNFGAYTGEVSATMLKELSVKFCIIGHSERRILLNETDEILLYKLENVISNNLIPIFCIGEHKSLRESDKYVEFLIKQLQLLIQIKTPLSSLVIAYEPIWAIGSGIVPTLDQISEVTKLIQAFVQNNLPHVKITILYGGSVSGSNAHAILNLDVVGGVLVGGASLKKDEFTNICTY